MVVSGLHPLGDVMFCGVVSVCVPNRGQCYRHLCRGRADFVVPACLSGDDGDRCYRRLCRGVRLFRCIIPQIQYYEIHPALGVTLLEFSSFLVSGPNASAFISYHRLRAILALQRLPTFRLTLRCFLPSWVYRTASQE